MDKIETLGQETLDTTQQKGTIAIETIEQETIEIPDYRYGLGQNTINANFGIRNIPKINFGEQGSLPTSTGLVSYTGVGFKPTSIEIQAIGWFNSGKSAFSSGYSDGTNEGAVRGYDANFRSSNEIINLYDSTSTNSWKATLDSFDSDGFTLDWTAILNDGSAGSFIFKCYK